MKTKWKVHQGGNVESKPHPRTMTGEAHVHMQNGRVTDALRAHAREHHERVVFETLSNPLTLSGQPLQWVRSIEPTYPTAYTAWVDAVQRRVKNVASEIAHQVAFACKKPTHEVRRPTVRYCGKADIVYLDRCPLCEEAGIRLQHVHPHAFTAPRWITRVLRAQVCDHRLPLDPLLWQAILNINALIAEDRITLS